MSSQSTTDLQDSPLFRQLEDSLKNLDQLDEVEDRVHKYLDELNIVWGDPVARQREYEESQRNKIVSQKKIGQSPSPSGLLQRRQSLLKLQL